MHFSSGISAAILHCVCTWWSLNQSFEQLRNLATWQHVVDRKVNPQFMLIISLRMR